MEMTATAATNLAAAHPDETRDLAYQMWAFLAGRNAAEVSRLLAAESISVPERTVQHWAREYGWAERADTDVHKIAPDLRFQAFSELLFAGLDGAKYLRRVAAGLEDEPDVSTIPKSDDPDVTYDRIMAKVKSHDAARKARIQASIAAVDRIGFSPIGKGTPAAELPSGKQEDVTTTDDLRGLSPDDLMRREEQARARKK